VQKELDRDDGEAGEKDSELCGARPATAFTAEGEPFRPCEPAMALVGGVRGKNSERRWGAPSRWIEARR